MADKIKSFWFINPLIKNKVPDIVRNSAKPISYPGLVNCIDRGEIAIKKAEKSAEGLFLNNSKTNKKVQNYTDQNGDFIWVFSTDKAGTFNISAIANSDGYNQVSSYRTFDIQ